AVVVPGRPIAPEPIEQVARGKARQGDLAGGLEGRRLQLEVGLDALASRRRPELHELADHPLAGLGISRHSVQNLVLHGGGGLHCASPSLLRPPPAWVWTRSVPVVVAKLTHCVKVSSAI